MNPHKKNVIAKENKNKKCTNLIHKLSENTDEQDNDGICLILYVNKQEEYHRSFIIGKIISYKKSNIVAGNQDNISPNIANRFNNLTFYIVNHPNTTKKEDNINDIKKINNKLNLVDIVNLLNNDINNTRH